MGDRIWSLYMGRPVTLKINDVSADCLSFNFDKLLACKGPGQEKKIGTRIYELLIRLVVLASPLGNLGEYDTSTWESYLKMTAIGQDLKNCHATIPEDLRWPSKQPATMPPSYFLLQYVMPPYPYLLYLFINCDSHFMLNSTQYHTSMILLHAPFANRLDTDQSSEATVDEGLSRHFVALSRSASIDHAKCIATIFDQYTTRLDPSQVFGTAIYHASTAATALMRELARVGSGITLAISLEHILTPLMALRTVLDIMGRTYQLAATSTTIIDQFLAEIRLANEMAFANLEVGDLVGYFDEEPSTDSMINYDDGTAGSDPMSRMILDMPSSSNINSLAMENRDFVTSINSSSLAFP